MKLPEANGSLTKPEAKGSQAGPEAIGSQAHAFNNELTHTFTVARALAHTLAAIHFWRSAAETHPALDQTAHAFFTQWARILARVGIAGVSPHAPEDSRNTHPQQETTPHHAYPHKSAYENLTLTCGLESKT